MPITIKARENDRNGFKVIGNLRERGKSVDLTGFAVFYEAISPLGFFVRDNAVVTNIKDGVFEYTVSKEAVSSSGVWIGYFAFEKGTERFTTQDIRLSLGCDVKSGSIQLENYIAEFDKIKKQVDALQLAVDKADVVKKSGGTMTGDLKIDKTPTVPRYIDFMVDGVTNFKIGMNSQNNVAFFDSKNGAIPLEYKLDTRTLQVNGSTTGGFNVICDTNLLKKTEVFTDIAQPNGDAIIQAKDASNDILQMALDAGRGFRTIYAAGSAKNVPSNAGLRGFVNLHGTRYGYIIATDFRNKIWTNYINGGEWQGWVNVNGNDKDTDWTPLTLLNGVKQQSSQPASAIKRSGNVVNIVCAITDFKDKQVIANVPAIFRPDREMLFTCDYFQGLVLKTGYVIVKPNGDIYLEGIEAVVSLYRFALTYIV
ncbi:BppU family phage baseplate upper protein [Bacillus sp. RC251]|uniref:BppU family phage baseplate upper protein n=1 Tax=Bacillus sp. RC251 TaxID=3156290 RepID=UPI00384ADD1C